MSEQEEMDYMYEIDPEEYQSYKDYYDLTSQYSGIISYCLWYVKEFRNSVRKNNPTFSYCPFFTGYEDEEYPKGKLQAYKILINSYRSGNASFSGFTLDVSLNILKSLINYIKGNSSKEDTNFLYFILKDEDCHGKVFSEEFKDYKINIEKILKKFNEFLFYFLRARQYYRNPKTIDFFREILDNLDEIVKERGDYFLENRTIYHLIGLFCGSGGHVYEDEADNFINFENAFKYASYRENEFEVQDALREFLSRRGLNSEAVKVLKSMVDKFGYKVLPTISYLLYYGHLELEKDREKAIFYLEKFLEEWKFDEEKGEDYDFPLSLDWNFDDPIDLGIKQYFDGATENCKNILNIFCCALKILELSEDFDCYDEILEWYEEFFNKNFDKLIEFGKKAKNNHSSAYLKKLLSFCFAHLNKSSAMQNEVIFLCVLPLSDEEIFEDWYTWGSQIYDIDDQDTFEQVVKVIYINLKKRFEVNPGITDYLFNEMSESPEQIEKEEDLLLPRNSKWYLLPMKDAQEDFDDFEIETSFESSVKADTYKIKPKQPEKKSRSVIPLKENWNFPDVRTSQKNKLFLSKDFLIVFMVRPLTLGASSAEPHETYIQHLYAITAYSRVNESTVIDPNSPVNCFSIQKASMPMAVPMLSGYYASGRQANFGSYREDINDEEAAFQILVKKLTSVLEIDDELTRGEGPSFSGAANRGIQKKQRKTDSICNLLRSKLSQIS